MNLKDVNYPCICMCKGQGESSSARKARLNERKRKLPHPLNDEPFVSWYRCSKCGSFWIRILFEGYHTGSFTFYATHVEQGVIETFHIDLIDEIFLVSDITFVGGYDFGDRTSVYKGGFPVDLWSGFRNQERLLKAKEFAVKAHGQQMYGDKPYVIHLEHVHEVMKRYRHSNPDVLVQMAGWLHDVLEDTAISKAELVKNFGEEIADIVYRVTDEPGADRTERKRKTYRKIRGQYNATTVKLCDRIANVEASSDIPEKLKMYMNEHREFRDAVCFKDHDLLLGDMWSHLDQLLGFDSINRCGIMDEIAAQVHGKELVGLQFRDQTRNIVILSGRDSTSAFDAHQTVESFNTRHGTNLRIVPHNVADFALSVGDTWRSLASCFGFTVDATIAHEKPGTKLGEKIVFSLEGEPKVVMATGKYKGEKDVALVTLGLSANDFKKEDNSIVLDISDDRLIVVPNFPAESGWYMPHNRTGVPHGREVEESLDARYLNKNYRSSYVGPLVRSVDADGCNLRQYVVAFSKASWKYAVVAEVPEGDTAKIEALLNPA